jgi:hypothetical protein
MLKTSFAKFLQFSRYARTKKSPVMAEIDVKQFKNVLETSTDQSSSTINAVCPRKETIFDESDKDFPTEIWADSKKNRLRTMTSLQQRRLFVHGGKEYVLRIGFWYYLKGKVIGVKIMLRIGKLRPFKYFTFKKNKGSVEDTIKASEDFYQSATGINLDKIDSDQNVNNIKIQK